MRSRLSQTEMHERVMVAFRKRIDIGLMNAITNSVQEPPNPFQPEEKRRPKRGFVIAVVIGGMILGSFVYFNFLSLP